MRRKNLGSQFMFVGIMLILAMPCTSYSTTINMSMGGGDPYWNDYDVVFGLGDVLSPDWSVQVAWDHSFGDAFDYTGSASYDISSVYDDSITQDWFVFVDDNWGYNYSYLLTLTVFDTENSITFATTDTPIYIGDYGQAYAFVQTNPDAAAAVPEPGTMLLMGSGLLGLVGYSRKRSKKS